MHCQNSSYGNLNQINLTNQFNELTQFLWHCYTREKFLAELVDDLIYVPIKKLVPVLEADCSLLPHIAQRALREGRYY